MPAGARGLQLAEDLFQQLALKQPVSLGRQLKSAFAPLQTLPLGQLADVVVDLLLQRRQPFHIARLGVLGQLLHVDDADLGRAGGFFKLFQQLVNLLQLFLDGNRLRHGQRLAAGELVLARQFVHLVLIAQLFDKFQQLPGKGGAFAAGAIPDLLQFAKLLLLERLFIQSAQRLGGLERFADVAIFAAGRFADLPGLVGFQDPPLPL